MLQVNYSTISGSYRRVGRTHWAWFWWDCWGLLSFKLITATVNRCCFLIFNFRVRISALSVESLGNIISSTQPRRMVPMTRVLLHHLLREPLRHLPELWVLCLSLPPCQSSQSSLSHHRSLCLKLSMPMPPQWMWLTEHLAAWRGFELAAIVSKQVAPLQFEKVEEHKKHYSPWFDWPCILINFVISSRISFEIVIIILALRRGLESLRCPCIAFWTPTFLKSSMGQLLESENYFVQVRSYLFW